MFGSARGLKTAFTVCLCAVSVCAADLKSYQAIYQSNAALIPRRYQPKFDDLQQQYLKSLAAIQTKSTADGDTQQALLAAAEQSRFRNAWSMPAKKDATAPAWLRSLRTEYVRQYNRIEQEMVAEQGTLAQKYAQALERLGSDLDKSGKRDDALVVKQELVTAQKTVKAYADQMAGLRETATLGIFAESGSSLLDEPSVDSRTPARSSDGSTARAENLRADSGTAAAPTPAIRLEIGGPAPALSQGRYVQGDPVAAFEKGKVYVIEFWATWCGPCRNVIPHVNALQTKYGDRGLVVIGQNVWQRGDNVEQDVVDFVKQMGAEMAYRVALDRDGAMAETWLKAAGRNGIPCVFVVDKEGKIAWIGHPASGLNEAVEPLLVGDSSKF